MPVDGGEEMDVIRMTNISKTYPGTVALDGVDFYLKKGEILSLLGENGAGKTTLMKILYGMIHADTGEVFYKGERVYFNKPLDAINMGIGMVHQHFMLVPAFSVTENIVAGSEPHRGVLLDKKEAGKKVGELIKRFNFNISPDTKVEKLSVGEQQRVEILKALYRKAEILILDEPTAVLTPREVNELFLILRELKRNGCSIVIITHKLRETLAIADRIAVLRDGRMIENNVDPNEATIIKLSEMMVGRQVDLSIRRPAKNIGEVCLKVRNLTVSDGNKNKVNNISFDIRKGEILGIAGVEGNGQTELIEALTGLISPLKMELELNGKELRGNAADFLKNRIGHVPEDRLSMGLVREMSVKYNMILGYHKETDICQRGFLKWNKINEYAQNLKEKYGVKTPNVENPVDALSGGNQQKIVIARVFSRNPEVLIIAHPTRGVDIGAMEYIHSQIIKLRDQGKAILLISADLDEVRTLSDRLMVIYEGSIVSESLPEQLNEIELGLLMTGNKLESGAGGR